MLDLRERLEMTRHVNGCALLDERGEVLGVLGAEGEVAVTQGRALALAFSAIGVREVCFAGSLDLAGGQLVARTEGGRLLVVRTDGAIALGEGHVEALLEALAPHEDRLRFESGIRPALSLREAEPARRRIG